MAAALTARVGCAGWSLRSEHADMFPGAGSHLERYARVFDMVEINSSFYRPHRYATYLRWAGSVPDDFRFAVKFPRAATHEGRLRGCEDVADAFFAQVAGLGAKLGPVLVQLPPSLALVPDEAEAFFAMLRARAAIPLVCEPRHPSWFTPQADALWTRHRIGRVAADPARWPAAAAVGGAGPVAYWRLHGTPRTYYEAYGPERLAAWAQAMRAARSGGQAVWAVLDNTALGHATPDALLLQEMLRIG